MEEHGGPVRVGSDGDDRHSRMGLASFVVAVLTTLLLVVLVVLAAIFGGQVIGSDPQSLTPEDLQRNLESSPGAKAALGVAGFGILLCPLLYLVGLGLGIAGLVQRRRRKLFSWLGTALSGLALLAIVGFFVLGIVLSRTM